MGRSRRSTSSSIPCPHSRSVRQNNVRIFEYDETTGLLIGYLPAFTAETKSPPSLPCGLVVRLTGFAPVKVSKLLLQPLLRPILTQRDRQRFPGLRSRLRIAEPE